MWGVIKTMAWETIVLKNSALMIDEISTKTLNGLQNFFGDHCVVLLSYCFTSSKEVEIYLKIDNYTTSQSIEIPIVGENFIVNDKELDYNLMNVLIRIAISYFLVPKSSNKGK